MSNSFNNFDNSDNFRNSPIIKERVSLISAHMYKQFCDYQHANENSSEIFANMAATAKDFTENIKQSFAARGVATENIWVKIDTKVPAIVINIFWVQYSFTMRCNFKPQALFRDKEPALFSGRIMSVKGDYFDIVSQAKNNDDEMAALLDNEIASLFVPENKMQSAIFKLKHRANKEFLLAQIDAGREFVLTVSEAICGGTIYHEEGSRKSFNI
ncbi:hypothetical protein IJ818_00015 [bacterium]|nr:hypothetical protein [bacterium]